MQTYTYCLGEIPTRINIGFGRSCLVVDACASSASSVCARYRIEATSVWDSGALNQLNQFGASREIFSRNVVLRAIQLLQARFGELPVTGIDNPCILVDIPKTVTFVGTGLESWMKNPEESEMIVALLA